MRRRILMIDFVMQFLKANGKRAPKVFKLKKLRLPAGDKHRNQQASRHPANFDAKVLSRAAAARDSGEWAGAGRRGLRAGDGIA